MTLSILRTKKAMKLISTLKICIIVLLGILALSSCSTDGYGDNESESNTNVNTISTNDQAGARDNSNSYGEGGSSSESSGSGLEVPDSPLSFDITNNGAVSYVFNNDELENSENPTIVLKRGETYVFNIAAPGHPFFIKEVRTITDADTYNEGINNNGTSAGIMTFEVTQDTPDTLYYICEFHPAMSGIIEIQD